jgi:hydrogenase expression/formation protein HypC
VCLGIPGEILGIREDSGLTVGKVRFGGILKDVCLACVPEAVVGDFVLVHVGFAIAKLDRAEAERVYETLDELGLLAELGDGEPTAGEGSA